MGHHNAYNIIYIIIKHVFLTAQYNNGGFLLICRTIGRKKKDKAMQQAMMMAGMTAAAVMGPMALKIIALIAVKALLISKIALVLSGIMVLKKLMQPQQGGGHETESSSHHYGRSMQLESAAHHMAYSSQKQ